MVSSWTHDGTSALPKRIVHHLTPKDAVEHHLQQLAVAAAATVLLARGLHERLLEEQPLRQVARGWTWWPGCASMDDDSLRATLMVVLVVPDADDFTTPLAIVLLFPHQHRQI